VARGLWSGVRGPYFVAAAFPALLLVLAAPTAAELQVAVTPPAGKVVPETGMEPIEIVVTLDCQTLFLAGGVLGSVPVHLAINTSVPDVHAQGPASLLLGPQGCTPGALSVEANVTYRLFAGRHAPGLEPIAFTVQAEAQATNTYAGERASATFDAVVDYWGHVEAKAEARHAEAAEGEWLEWDVRVTNFGNAATTVDFQLAPDAEGWTLEAAPVVLAREGTAEVTIRARGPSDSTYVEVIVDPSAAADPTLKGTPMRLGFMANVRSAPSPVAVLPLALVAVALFLRRRA
jgi:hypothetical protein